MTHYVKDRVLSTVLAGAARMILHDSAHAARSVKDLRRVSFTRAVLDSGELLHQRLTQVINPTSVGTVDVVGDLQESPRGVVLSRLDGALGKALWRRRLHLGQHSHVIVVLRSGRVAIGVGDSGGISECVAAVRVCVARAYLVT